MGLTFEENPIWLLNQQTIGLTFSSARYSRLSHQYGHGRERGQRRYPPVCSHRFTQAHRRLEKRIRERYIPREWIIWWAFSHLFKIFQLWKKLPAEIHFRFFLSGKQFRRSRDRCCTFQKWPATTWGPTCALLPTEFHRLSAKEFFLLFTVSIEMVLETGVPTCRTFCPSISLSNRSISTFLFNFHSLPEDPSIPRYLWHSSNVPFAILPLCPIPKLQI